MKFCFCHDRHYILSLVIRQNKRVYFISLCYKWIENYFGVLITDDWQISLYSGARNIDKLFLIRIWKLIRNACVCFVFIGCVNKWGGSIIELKFLLSLLLKLIMWNLLIRHRRYVICESCNCKITLPLLENCLIHLGDRIWYIILRISVYEWRSKLYT